MPNYFDILVVIITLGLAVSGFFEGFVRGVIKLAGFIAVIVFLVLFSDTIIDIVIETVDFPPKFAIPLVFLIVFAVSSVSVYFIAEMLHKIIKLTPVRIIDSGLGSVFGLIKSFFICGILAMFLSFTTTETFLNNQYESSRTAEPLKNLFYRAVPIMKSAIIPIYRKYIPVPEDKEKKEEKNDKSIVI
ncbi:CvpA family protein [Candidatus Latescibacterota bacterium]